METKQNPKDSCFAYGFKNHAAPIKSPHKSSKAYVHTHTHVRAQAYRHTHTRTHMPMHACIAQTDGLRHFSASFPSDAPSQMSDCSEIGGTSAHNI